MTSRLDSRALELFLAVAQTLSFRQAAETLHMTQPPLSRSIRELEERLGTRLFDRDTQGVALTDAGQALVPYAKKMAALLKEAAAAVQARSTPEVWRLGVTTALEVPLLKRLPAALSRKYPDMTLEVVSDTSPRLVKRLRAGRLDAAYIALPTEAGGLNVIELAREPMMVAVPSHHPLARRRQVQLADLDAESVFWFERARQPAFYDHCERVFARHGLSARRMKEPSDHHVLLADVAMGKGIAFVPRSISTLRRAGVSYRQLAEGNELAVALGLVMAKDHRDIQRLLMGAPSS